MDMKTAISEAVIPSLEPLYNHKSTCEALIQHGPSAAAAVFRSQARCLDQVNGAYVPELRCIMLNSLNRSLYNYILYLWNVSLTECCFQNKAPSHQFDSTEEFLKAGECIIATYSSYITFQPVKASHIAKACRYIENHLAEDLSLDTVASAIFVSKCYLCKIFKPFTGHSFSSYINEQRLVCARNLLLTTNDSVDKVAEQCGFRSSSYFSTAFKKGTGSSPQEFRRKYRVAV